MLAGNSFATQTMLLLCVYFFATGSPQHIDIALLYALLNYVGALALVNYFQVRAAARHGGRGAGRMGRRQ